MIRAEQFVGTRNPLIEIFLDQPGRNDARFHDAAQAIVAGAHVERFLAQHIRHGPAQRREGGIFEHLQLELAVAIHEVGIREKIHPVVHVDIERTQQAFVLKRSSLQHFLSLNLARITEVIDQQRTHLPAMTHFLDHDPSDGAAIPIGWCTLEQIALLLHAGEFRVALVDDHVDQRIAHLLRRHLAQVLPLTSSFEVTKLNFFRFDRAEKRVELEAGDLVVVDANLFAPIVKQTNPVTERSDLCDFTGHKTSTPLSAGLIAPASFRLRAGQVLPAVLGAAPPRRWAGERAALYYFALNVAGRFSTYAAKPSLASSLWNSSC